MKKFLSLVVMSILISCSTTKQSSSDQTADQLLLTRKYIGDFIEYYHTDPEIVGGKDLIWIKTSLYTTYGRLSAYGKTCEFSVGDRIYLKPTHSIPGNFGYWEYQVENDASISYKVSEYRFENNVFFRSMAL